MATVMVKTTFALDVATANSIQRLAKVWKTSKAEVVRRSVAQAESALSEQQARPSPLEALEWLQSHGTLTETAAQAWAKESKRGWDESWRRKERLRRARASSRTKGTR